MTNHGKLLVEFEFWILVGFESWWCDLGLPKGGGFGENGILLKNIFGKSEELLVFCSRISHIYFWYITDFMCCFDFIFNKTWNSAIILI
jgi:hypothetical protein